MQTSACSPYAVIAIEEMARNGGLAETQGFEPWIRRKAYDDLANRCLQPLGHVSGTRNPYSSRTARSNGPISFTVVMN